MELSDRENLYKVIHETRRTLSRHQERSADALEFTMQTGKIYTTAQGLQIYTLVEATGQVLKAHKIYTATYVYCQFGMVLCIRHTHRPNLLLRNSHYWYMSSDLMTHHLIYTHGTSLNCMENSVKCSQIKYRCYLHSC